MALVHMQGVTLNLGGKNLLENADFSLEAGERVCVAGRNGAGKSSFLGLLDGRIEPDSGLIVRNNGPMGAMAQDVPAGWTGTVFDVVTAGEAESGVAAKITAPGTARPEENWERSAEALGVINRLGLDPDAVFSSLSGGTKRRVALARALACSQDLILDEPTNHLDLAAIAWLEEFLQRRARTLIFVSHDRSFARRLATRVVELDRGRLYSYACGYDAFLERREERLENEAGQRALFDRKLAAEEVWIRQGIKARRTRNMGRVRALRRMREERADRQERLGSVRMRAQEAERSGKLVLEADNAGFAWPGRDPLFTGFSTVIQRGDRVGLIGANGAGKTTLLRVLLGELAPTKGRVRQGTRLEISYFDQLRETLDPAVSVMDSVANGNDTVMVNGAPRHVAGYLQDFLFPADRLRVPVGTLSGGERNRLLLARLFTRPSNLLVLDEPTNDLDVETLELLEETLADYTGTVILVSHDRTFLDNLATSVLALEGDGLVREYAGAYTDWLRQRTAPEERPAPRSEHPRHRRPDRPRKRTFNEQREYDRLLERLDGLPGELERLEAEQAALEQALADPEFYARDPEAFGRAGRRLEAIEDEQTSLLEEWEQAEARRDELAALGG